jgi:twitching motility protein PilJ
MPSNTGNSGFLANLTMGRKLLLMLAVMGVPLAFLLVLLIQARDAQIDAARNEIDGVEHIAAMRGLLEAIPQHRSLTYAAINGDASQRGRAEQLQPAIDRYLSGVDAAAAKLSVPASAGDRLGQIKRGWQEVKMGALKMTAKEATDAHNRLMDDVVEYVRQIGDRSGLISDPELDTYYLMDAAVNHLPVITDRSSRLAYLVSSAVIRKTAEDRIQVQVVADQVEGIVQQMQRGLGVAFSANPSIEPKVNPALVAAVRGSDTWLRPLREGNVERFGSADRALEGSNASLNGLFALYDAALPNLKGLLEARISRLNREKYTQLVLALLIVVIAAGVASMVNRSVTSQIRQINDAFAQIGQGNYEVRVPVTGRDELSQMAGSLNSVLDDTLGLIQTREERNRIQQSIQKLLDDVSGVASGDLTQEAEVTADITGTIADSFNYMIGELRQLVVSVNQTTTHVGRSAKQVLETTERLADGSVGQARQIASATASVEQMVKSIREVSSTASNAASVADQTFQKAKQGSDAVQKTIHGMGGIRNQVQETSKRLKGLGERSQEIGSIVQLIGDIADRTSILALNASIQAAMAGEAGRGFAVVAEEVERLAERAAEATKKVNTLIKSIQADTSEAITAMEETTREVVEGSNLANAAGRTLSEIESVSAQLTNLIQSISVASESQARDSELISKSMGEISAHTQGNVEGAKVATDSVQQLASFTEELRRSMQRFRLPADEYARH